MAGRTLGDDFDDDDGEIEFDKGSSMTGPGGGSAYDTSGLSLSDDFGDDDEPSAAPSLELDVPLAPASARSLPVSGPVLSAPPAGPASSPSLPVGGVAGAPPSSRSLPVSGAASGSMPQGEGSQPGIPAPPASSPGGEAPPPPSSSPALPPPPSKPSSAQLIAKYPAAPSVTWQMPVYACRVLWRQLELRQDLTSLRRKRSPDVPLYEAALKAYEPRAFAIGMAITCAVLAVATILFFMPVILRFASAPD